MAVNPFTGLDDGADNPTQSILGGLGDATLSDPKSRAALLQIGLQMMQPMAMGQTVGGHIGQAIGAGGEAIGRQETTEEKQRALDIKQEEADAYREAQSGADKEITPYQREVLSRQDAQEQRRLGHETRMGEQSTRRELRGTAAREATRAREIEKDLLLSDEQKRASTPYYGMTEDQIYDQLMAKERRDSGGGGASTGAPAGSKPRTIRQNGFTYELQPDGTYK